MIELSQAAATELANALQVPPPEPHPALDGAIASVTFKAPGGVLSVTKQKGVASVTRTQTGIFQVTLLEPMEDVNYQVFANGRTGTGVPAFRCEPPTSSTRFSITCWNNSVVVDPEIVHVRVYAG